MATFRKEKELKVAPTIKKAVRPNKGNVVTKPKQSNRNKDKRSVSFVLKSKSRSGGVGLSESHVSAAIDSLTSGTEADDSDFLSAREGHQSDDLLESSLSDSSSSPEPALDRGSGTTVGQQAKFNSLKPAELIHPFGGDTYDCAEACHFVKTFKSIAKEANWSDRFKLHVFESKLTSRAREIYFNSLGLNKYLSMKDRLQAFQAIFSPPVSLEDRRERFDNCKQEKDESVALFKNRLDALSKPMRRINPTPAALDRAMTYQFRKGLREDLKYEIYKSTIKGYENTVKYAIHLESAIANFKKNKSTAINAVLESPTEVLDSEEINLEKEVNELRELLRVLQEEQKNTKCRVNPPVPLPLPRRIVCEFCGMAGHVRSTCRRSSQYQRVPLCQNCGRWGHKTENCRLRMSAYLQGVRRATCNRRNVTELVYSKPNKNITELGYTVNYNSNLYLKKQLIDIIKTATQIEVSNKSEVSSSYSDDKTQLASLNHVTKQNHMFSQSNNRNNKANEYIISLSESNENLPIIPVRVYNKDYMALLDSGATKSIINAGILNKNKKIKRKSKISLFSPISKDKRDAFLADVSLQFQNFKVEQEVCFTEISCNSEYDIILGYDFFLKNNVILNSSESSIRLVPSINMHTSSSRSVTSCSSGAVFACNKRERDFQNMFNNLKVGNFDLIPNIKNKFELLIKKYRCIMIEDVTKMTGCTLPPIKPEFTSNVPIYTRQYKIPHSLLAPIRAKLLQFEQAKIISRGESEWNVPLLAVKKEDGDVRLVLDLRQINNITKPLPYPQHNLQDILGQLSGSKVFSKIDLNNGFYQIALDPTVRNRFCFTVPWGRYQLNRIAQGSLTSSAHFQKIMNELLADLIAEGKILSYQDDLLVHTNTAEEHLEVLSALFEKLKSINLVARPSKCSFFQESVTFLGHKVDAMGAVPLADRILAIKKIPRPKTVRQVRSFIGTVNFYRKFIPNVTDKAAPLYNLIKKGNSRIKWDDSCTESFESLKEALSSAPLLAHPNFAKTFYIKSDASDIAVGGVLEQINDNGDFQPIAFCSKKLNKAERNYATIEKEAYALTYCLKQFRHFVYGYEIVLKTDHKPLSFIFKMKENNQRVMRWLLLLQDYQLKIEHLPGKLNVVADMLSRNEDNDETACLNNILHHDNISIDLIKQHQQKDLNCKNIYDSLLKKDFENKQFILDENHLVLKKIFPTRGRGWNYRILVPHSLSQQIIANYHDKGFSAHFSIKKVIWKIKHLFTWETMFSDIEKYIKTCVKCQKRNLHLKRAPFQPQIPPSYPFQRLSVDFLGPFVRSEGEGNRYLLLFIDQFTRFPIGIPTRDLEAATVAKAYVAHVYSQYGGSEVILSDRGANFTSHLFNNVCNRLGVKHITTTAFRPQANGIVERANRVIINILAQICNRSYNNWDEVLPHALREIRTNVHNSTGESPHYLLYGFDPIDCRVEASLPRENRVYYNTPDFVELLTSRITAVRDVIEENLINSSISSCNYRNKGRTPFNFNVGDKVWLLDSTSFAGKNRKLKPRYKGPYRVIEARGLVNVRIRNVNKGGDVQIVHIDKLKPAYDRKVFNDGPRNVTGGEGVSSSRLSIKNDLVANSVESDSESDDELDDVIVLNRSQDRVVPLVDLIDPPETQAVSDRGEAVLNDDEGRVVRAGCESHHTQAPQIENVPERRATRSTLKLPVNFFNEEGRYLEGRKYNG